MKRTATLNLTPPSLSSLWLVPLQGAFSRPQLPFQAPITSREQLSLMHPWLLSLPDSIDKLSCLKVLSLSFCCTLQWLPDSIGQLRKLEVLDLASCWKLESLPESVGQLTQLKHLDLTECKSLQVLPDLSRLNITDPNSLKVSRQNT